MYHKKLVSFTQVERLDISVVDVTTSISFYGILKHAIMLQEINHAVANGSARSKLINQSVSKIENNIYNFHIIIVETMTINRN